MTNWIIDGKKPLEGTVSISGSKNAVLPILFATLLTEEPCEISNVPSIADVDVALRILQKAGARVQRCGDICRIDTREAHALPVLDETEKLRGASYLMGASLGRFRTAALGRVGGCDFGNRPMDLHIKAFCALGATVCEDGDVLRLEGEHCTGGTVSFPRVSVGATINSMLLAVAIPGETVLHGAAREPHVVDTARFLQKCGAEIYGVGSGTIRILGNRRLHGCRYKIVPDMVEAGTYLSAGAAAGGDLLLRNAPYEQLKLPLRFLEAMGVEISGEKDRIRLRHSGILRGGARIVTAPYPGFPTDLQPMFGVLLSLAEGGGVLTERIFPGRFRYLEELRRMGTRVTLREGRAIFQGSDRLHGADLQATDLRASAALIVAALAAEGRSLLHGNGYPERGYERMAEKLSGVGAAISAVNVPPFR